MPMRAASAAVESPSSHVWRVSRSGVRASERGAVSSPTRKPYPSFARENAPRANGARGCADSGHAVHIRPALLICAAALVALCLSAPPAAGSGGGAAAPVGGSPAAGGGAHYGSAVPATRKRHRRRRVVRRPPAPAPAPAPLIPAGDHVFPVAGEYSLGGDGAKFGAPRSGHTHMGHDVSAARGTPVVAPYAGVIDWVRFQRAGAGHYVVLDADDDHDYVFMHLRRGSILVAAGQRVAAGEQIGQVGQQRALVRRPSPLRGLGGRLVREGRRGGRPAPAAPRLGYSIASVSLPRSSSVLDDR